MNLRGKDGRDNASAPPPGAHFEKSATRRQRHRRSYTTHDWIASMGRKAKGDRHKIIASMPPRAAELVRADAKNLGCFIGDYLGWLVSAGVGQTMDVPLGAVTDYPAPSPASDGRVRYAAMVPRAAAVEVISVAETHGITMGDVVTHLVCTHFGIPFTPHTNKRARRAWADSQAGERLPMTG